MSMISAVQLLIKEKERPSLEVLHAKVIRTWNIVAQQVCRGQDLYYKEVYNHINLMIELC